MYVLFCYIYRVKPKNLRQNVPHHQFHLIINPQLHITNIQVEAAAAVIIIIIHRTVTICIHMVVVVEMTVIIHVVLVHLLHVLMLPIKRINPVKVVDDVHPYDPAHDHVLVQNQMNASQDVLGHVIDALMNVRKHKGSFVINLHLWAEVVTRDMIVDVEAVVEIDAE